MKKINNKRGFTLVELLVVISIIAMLAALLMPAIQMAKEAARRIDCTSNQRNVAAALLTYESFGKPFPALRGPLKPKEFDLGTGTGTASTAPDRLTSLTWVAFLLPYVEQSPAWDRIKSADIIDENYDTLYSMSLPIMKCKSSGVSPQDRRISYVANAGPINPNPSSSIIAKEFAMNDRITSYNVPDRPQKDEKMYTIFFDQLAYVGNWSDVNTNIRCSTGVTLGNITSMDGATQTILISENVDAGEWIWPYIGNTNNLADRLPCACDEHFQRDYDDRTNMKRIESEVGFCYPDRFDSRTRFEEPVYVSGIDYPAEPSPMFINEGMRSAGFVARHPARTARPSSGHPGVVIAAFCDGRVVPLRDSIDKTFFVRLCRPSSGVILNMGDLD